MSIKSAQAAAGLFVCRDSTGVLSTPTVGPVGALYVNGVVNGATVSITGTNPYKWAVTLPTLAAGDNLHIYITATIATIATATIVWQESADTYLVSDISARLPAALTTDGNIKADLLKWLGTAPATLTTNGYVQAMLLRWLSDNAAGTPLALTAAYLVQADAIKLAGATPNNLAAGAQMDLVNAPNATAITAIQSGLATLAKLLSYIKSLARSDFAEDADIGGTYDAATDSLQAIRDRGDVGWGLGAGATAKTYTVTSSVTGLPIADVSVWITTDLAGTNIIASGLTNASGQVILYPDVASGTTVYVWRQKTGYDFANPDAEVA